MREEAVYVENLFLETSQDLQKGHITYTWFVSLIAYMELIKRLTIDNYSCLVIQKME